MDEAREKEAFINAHMDRILNLYEWRTLEVQAEEILQEIASSTSPPTEELLHKLKEINELRNIFAAMVGRVMA